nr:MAG TPA: hypothetical protein [Caudoviricetes sp.]
MPCGPRRGALLFCRYGVFHKRNAVFSQHARRGGGAPVPRPG